MGDVVFVYSNSASSMNSTYNRDGVTRDPVGGAPKYNVEQHDLPAVTVMLVVCVVAVANVAIFVPWLCILRQRRRSEAQTAAARSLASSVEASRQAHNKELRYNDIESWVVSRTVLHHDSLCSKRRDSQENENLPKRMNVKRRTSTLETIDSTVDDTVRSEKNESSQCPICFDDMIPGDIASWSLDPDCRHVFHHACIKEWLVKHEACPFCRATFLPIDDARVKPIYFSVENKAAASQQVNLLMTAHNERIRSCFYCADHGVVYLPRCCPPSLDGREWQALQERGGCAPTRDALKLLRGNPADVVGNKTGRTEEEEGTTDVFVINRTPPNRENHLHLVRLVQEATSFETCENSIQMPSVDEECPSLSSRQRRLEHQGFTHLDCESDVQVNHASENDEHRSTP